MSAKNWTECPRCVTKHAAEVRKACERAARAYGRVSEAEYRRLNDIAMSLGAEAVPETLREDYELGVSDGGTFFVCYRCACEACGWEWEWEKEEKVAGVTGVTGATVEG